MFEEHFEKQATAYITVCVTNEWFVLTPVIIWRIMWYSFVNDEVGAEKSPPSANASPSSQLSAAGISAQSLPQLRTAPQPSTPLPHICSCAPLHSRALRFRFSRNFRSFTYNFRTFQRKFRIFACILKPLHVISEALHVILER